MEESQEILVKSLKRTGVPIPAGVCSVKDLTPPTLVSICSHSLHLVDPTRPWPASLPESMADQFMICTELASAVKNLGYVGDMSFHKFLYPSQDDMYKLVWFLVERLSESSEAGRSAGKKDVGSPSKDAKDKFGSETGGLHDEKVVFRLEDLSIKTKGAVSLIIEPEVDSVTQSKDSVGISKVTAAGTHKGTTEGSCVEEVIGIESGKGLKELEDSRDSAPVDVETVAQRKTEHGEQQGTLEYLPQMRSEIHKLQDEEKLLEMEVTTKSSELQHLEDEYNLLKAVEEMSINEHPIDYNVAQLTEQAERRRCNLAELQLQRVALRKPLEEAKRSLEESIYAMKPEAGKKLKKLKDTELETQFLLSEIQKREEQISKFSTDFDKQPKSATRRSYIERIIEITKNSRKQDTDIEQIINETRELQLESNSIQERLHRTYTVVDETVFREAKKDPVGRQAYRLLTNIHESFEEISEKILATDRTRRDVADLEAKLVAISSKSLNIDKLQADLIAIRKANEYLEQGHLDE